MTYTYIVKGTAANGQTWEVAGDIEKTTNFLEMVANIAHASFAALTEERAIYGHPGKGCHGPYLITSLLVEHDAH